MSVEQTIVKPNNEYQTSVYNEKFASVFYKSTTQKDLQGDIYHINDYLYTASATYVSLTPYYSNVLTINIPKQQKNKVIEKIFYGKDDDNNPNIKFSVYGDIYKSNATAIIDYSKGTSNISLSEISYTNEEKISDGVVLSLLDFEENYELEYTANPLTVPSTTISTIKLTQQQINISATHKFNATANSNIELKTISNILDENVINIDNQEQYQLHLEFLCGLEYDILGGHGNYFSGSNDFESEKWQMTGVNYKYIPTQIEITIYGNTIGIDLTDGSITYGSGNKPYSLSRNELLQESAYYSKSFRILVNRIDGDKVFFEPIETSISVGTTIVVSGFLRKEEYIVKSENGSLYLEKKDLLDTYIKGEYRSAHTAKILQTQFLSDKIKNQYSKGKETATLLCDIADYYDERGSKVISIKSSKMSFRLHDEVIPYVFGADGQDHPMSKYQDGSPKVFEVVGSNIIYDGAVWQELSLVEINN